MVDNIYLQTRTHEEYRQVAEELGVDGYESRGVYPLDPQLPRKKSASVVARGMEQKGLEVVITAAYYNQSIINDTLDPKNREVWARCPVEPREDAFDLTAAVEGEQLSEPDKNL